MSETVGLRALQQNASAVVARVVAGEEVVITDRGRPVARIVPLEPRRRGLQELIDEGLLTPATRSISDLPPPMVLSGGPTASEILAEMREADRER
jgi:prevent-host-death family protein